MTSSFTHWVPSASRANCAVSTASAAPRQPAVLGNGVMPRRVSRSSTPVPLSASTRRIATVVNSVPDATSASSSTARFEAPPVPMISREPNSRPAIVSLLTDEPLARRATDSATLHRRHHFHARAVGQRGFPFRSGQHRPVDRDRDALLRKAEAFHQRRDGRLVVDLHGFVVDSHLHRPAPTVTSSSAAIRSAVHGASRNPLRPWPAATSVRSSSRFTIGSPSGVIGRRPAAHSASSYSPSAGITAHASSRDRKSTRLNSSHMSISYAVFCLKKKNLH